MEPERISFPAADYPIKVVARAGEDIRSRIDAVFHHYFGDLPPGSVSERASAQAHFVALTYVVTAQSEAQLKDLNTDLQGIEAVMFVF
jgi:putative lipoic acid-binding regulatory protein